MMHTMKRGMILGVALALAAQAEEPTSRVVAVRAPDRPDVPAMVAAGLTALTGHPTVADAWRRWVSSNDVVGIKINTTAAPLQATRHAVVDALVDGLVAAGVARTNIWVFDRDPDKLRAAGYDRPQEVAIIGATGWDADQFYENRLVGRLIWGDLLFGRDENLSTRSHLPRLVTRALTKLINVPVLQDHQTWGIAGCLHNFSIGLVDNARRFAPPRGLGDPSWLEIATLPPLRDKTVLHVLDALVAGYAGGPDFKPRYSWPAGVLYFSRDPVAVDTLALELLEAKRREQHIPPLGERTAWLRAAPRWGLGQHDRSRIELMEIQP